MVTIWHWNGMDIFPLLVETLREHKPPPFTPSYYLLSVNAQSGTEAASSYCPPRIGKANEQSAIVGQRACNGNEQLFRMIRCRQTI